MVRTEAKFGKWLYRFAAADDLTSLLLYCVRVAPLANDSERIDEYNGYISGARVVINTSDALVSRVSK